MNLDTKILNKILANRIPAMHKKLYTITTWDLLQVCKARSRAVESRYVSLIEKSMNVTHHVNSLKKTKKSHDRIN